MNKNILKPYFGEHNYFSKENIYKRGLQYYKYFMPRKKRSTDVTIDHGQNFFFSPIVAKRIHEVQPNVKLMLMLCDPAKQALRSHIHRKVKSPEDIKSQLFSNTSINEKSIHILHGMYDDYMFNWMRYYNPHQIFYVDMEALLENPVFVLNKIEAFLGVNKTITEDDFVFDQNRRYYCRKLKGIANCKIEEEESKEFVINADLLRELHNIYRPHNIKLLLMISQKLSFMQL